jgi:hypothetical protein
MITFYILIPFKMFYKWSQQSDNTITNLMHSYQSYHLNLLRVPFEYLMNLARFMLLFVLNVLQMHVSIGSSFFLAGFF